MSEITSIIPSSIQAKVLSLPEDATVEQMAEARFLVDALKSFTRDMEHAIDERFLDIITKHGPVTIGDVRYYEGAKKTTKCVDVYGAVTALLSALGGDLETFCRDFLCGQPLKYGAAREPLGDDWNKFFKVEEEPKLCEGKPVRQLQKIDTRFIR